MATGIDLKRNLSYHGDAANLLLQLNDFSFWLRPCCVEPYSLIRPSRGVQAKDAAHAFQ